MQTPHSLITSLRHFCGRPRLISCPRHCASHRTSSISHVASTHVIDTAVADDPCKFYVTCNPGLEETVAETLAGPDVGARNVSLGKAGVYCTGSMRVGYAANLWLRSAIRVLLLVADDDLHGANDVYDFVRAAADWPALIPADCTFSIDTRVHDCPGVTSAQYVQTRTKDAICDMLRDARGTKPPPPATRGTADVPLFAALHRGRMTLYRDMSGESLHKRGYRDAMHRATLNESVAAGALLLAGWPERAQQGARLVDPMCGSGTFLLEAALMAQHAAPGLYRPRWPFQTWPDHERRTWLELVQEAQGSRVASPGVVLGNDVHSGALDLALKSAQAAGLESAIQLRQGSCRSLKLRAPPNVVMTNPPWGQRLAGAGGVARRRRAGRDKRVGVVEGVDDELRGVYEELGDWLKASAPGATAFVLSGNKDATHALHMRSSQKWPITVGGVDCRLIQYDVRARQSEAEEHAATVGSDA